MIDHKESSGQFINFPLKPVANITPSRQAINKQNQREAIATLVWDAHCHSGKDLPRDAAASYVRIAIRANNGWQLAADSPHLWDGEATPGVFDESDVWQCVSIIERIPGDIERAVSSGKFLMESGVQDTVESAVGDAVGRRWGLEGSPRKVLVTREAVRELRQITQAETDDFINRPRG